MCLRVLQKLMAYLYCCSLSVSARFMCVSSDRGADADGLSATATFGDNDFAADYDLRCTSSRNLIESTLRVTLGPRSGFGLRLCRRGARHDNLFTR